MNQNAKATLFIIAIAVLMVSFTYIGAWYSCDGEMLNGFKCGTIKVLTACEDLATNTLYLINESEVFNNEFRP